MSVIDEKYNELIANGLNLGDPLEPEHLTLDGIGRYRHYQLGSIYWTSDTGAHEIHGAINEKWISLGSENSPLGYPITDETSTPDGIGRFNHFIKVPGHEHHGLLNINQPGSIYWTPNTGAHEVYGLIRQKWAEMGFEQGPLGYPITGEKDFAFDRGRYNEFQGGSIYYDIGYSTQEPPSPFHLVHVVLNRPPIRKLDPKIFGKWKQLPFNLINSGIHAALLPTNRILFLSYRQPLPNPYLPREVSYYGDAWTLDLNSYTQTKCSYIGETQTSDVTNMFCSGHAFLHDGRLLIAGGDRERTVFEPKRDFVIKELNIVKSNEDSDVLSHSGNMEFGRWYPTCMTLPDGKILIFGGKKRIFGGEEPNTDIDTFDPPDGILKVGTTHTSVDNLHYGGASYPFIILLPSGKIFIHVFFKTTFLDSQTFAFENVELKNVHSIERTYGRQGTCVLLPLSPHSRPAYKAQIMVIGGGGNKFTGPSTNTCEKLDTSKSSNLSDLQWEKVAPMKSARVMPDSVLLPDGKILIMNGGSAGTADTSYSPVYEVELYDPETNTWENMASMKYPRLYHSVALLLPDGTVMTAGTDPIWNPIPFGEYGNKIEIFHPSYLFKGSRPQISAVPSQIDYNTTITVRSENAQNIDKVVIIRCGGVTHSFNSDQRLIELEIRDRSTNAIFVRSPPNGNIAPPGYYLFFILRNGIPSVGKFIKVPSWYKAGLAEISRHGIPESEFQEEVDHITGSGYKLEWVDGYNINGNVYFNIICRPIDGTEQSALHGYSSKQFQEQFDSLVDNGFRLSHIESYLREEEVRYAAIFNKISGPEFTAYHDANTGEHQASFNDLTSNGWVPINISVVSLSGSLKFSALYEKKDVGGFVARSFLTPDEYQAEFDINEEQGRKMVYLNAYTHLGMPRITAIWHQLTTSNDITASHGLDSDQFQSQWQSYLDSGFLTKAITGYEQGAMHTFAAYWAK